MRYTTRSYIRAVAALTGTTIGAGIFGIPYVMAQAGPVVGMLWVVGLGFILTITNLLHGEFSLRTRDDVKFVGIARRYLGRPWGRLVGVLTIISFYGSLLAYIIIGGRFLNTLLSPLLGDALPLVTLLYVVGTAAILYKGIAFLEDIELPLTGALLASLVVLSVFIAHRIDFAHFAPIHVENVLLPYGVVLFALGSISAITTVEQILDRNKKMLKHAIITSGFISVLVVLLFGLTIVGITGAGTSEEAILGLSGYFGDSILWVGALVGFLAIITSHLVIAHHLREIFQFDYDMHKTISWGLAAIVPYLIFLVAKVSFIAVIGFVGGVIGGITGNLVGYISLKSHEAKTREPEYCLKYDRFWAWIVIVVFTCGIVYQLYYTIFN